MGPSCRGSPASMVNEELCDARRCEEEGAQLRSPTDGGTAAPHRSERERNERLRLRRLRRFVHGHKAKVAGGQTQGCQHGRIPAAAADHIGCAHVFGGGRDKEVPLLERQRAKVVAQRGDQPPGASHDAKAPSPLSSAPRPLPLRQALQQLSRQHVDRALLGRRQQAAAAQAEGLGGGDGWGK